jgi:hypothetical protein
MTMPSCAWCHWAGPRIERELNYCSVLELWLCRSCFFSAKYSQTVTHAATPALDLPW